MTKSKGNLDIKCSPSFFNRKDITEIRSLPGGATFVIIYMKMLAEAVNSKGYISYEGIGSTLEEEIALTLDEGEKAVRMTLTLLSKHDLVEDCGNGVYYFPEAAKGELS